MKHNISTVTGSVNYDAPTITSIDRFTASTATQREPLFNFKTTEPCTII